jgi:lipopolysaccharide export system ATP-binding protein
MARLAEGWRRLRKTAPPAPPAGGALPATAAPPQVRVPAQAAAPAPPPRSPRPVHEGLLAVQHLAKSYRQRRVVEDVSLYIRRSEAVGLLGPNGAGKTTVFYMITGLVRPDHGVIELDGYDVTPLPMYRREPASASATCRRSPRSSGASRSRTISAPFWRSPSPIATGAKPN